VIASFCDVDVLMFLSMSIRVFHHFQLQRSGDTNIVVFI